jgi:hypothetical protein
MKLLAYIVKSAIVQNEYSCSPLPWFMLILSVFQIGRRNYNFAL